MSLPTDSKERKGIPIATGVLDYFPDAIAYIARVSKAGNDKHNPGQPLHWSRGKSADHADCIARHLIERGTVDPEDGLLHAGKLAWRALALLQLELEAQNIGTPSQVPTKLADPPISASAENLKLLSACVDPGPLPMLGPPLVATPEPAEEVE